MEALAREFAATRDIKVKEEIDRLGVQYGKLNEPPGSWRGLQAIQLRATLRLTLYSLWV
jgi:hypothetical protein